MLASCWATRKMSGAHTPPLLPLLLLLVVATCMGVTAGGEPVSYTVPKCPEKVIMETGMIIDIQGSRKKGAVLLDGLKESTLTSCVQQCCGRSGCELAVFKVDGYSNKGNNCYLIHCGAVERCLMVNHQGFVSTFGQKLIASSRVDGGNARPQPVTEAPGVISEATAQHPVPTHSASSSSSSPTTAATSSVDTDTVIAPTSYTPTASTTSATDQASSSTSPATSHVDSSTGSTTSTTSDSTETPTSVTSDPTSTSKEAKTDTVDSPTDEDGGGGEGLSSVGDGLTEGQEDTKAPDSSSSDLFDGVDPCGRDGCDGRGVIAVVVLASLSGLVLILIVMLVLRRMYRVARKRRFGNVDYLINGMYS